MKNRVQLIAMFVVVLLAFARVSAQTGGVLLKPVLKVGEEARYLINGSVDEQVTPEGVGGIAGKVRRTVSATLLLRAKVQPSASLTENEPVSPILASLTRKAGMPGDDLSYYEAIIEAFEAHTVIDGVEKPATAEGIVGQKIEFELDAAGNVAKCMLPVEAVRAGLVELVLGLTTWAPVTPLEVGQTWGNLRTNTGIGNYGYINTARLSDISRRAKTAYTFTSLKDDRAVIDGTIELRQDGASMLDFPAGPTRVNAIASGNGSTHIEVDVASRRIVSATSETVLNGKLVNIPPTREGEKMQPRAGALVETAKFSIKLIQ